MRQVFVVFKGVGSWVSEKHLVRGLAVYRAISGDLTVNKKFGLNRTRTSGTEMSKSEECKWCWLLQLISFRWYSVLLYMLFFDTEVRIFAALTNGSGVCCTGA